MLKFLALQGAPYIYDISRLRVKSDFVFRQRDTFSSYIFWCTFGAVTLPLREKPTSSRLIVRPSDEKWKKYRAWWKDNLQSILFQRQFVDHIFLMDYLGYNPCLRSENPGLIAWDSARSVAFVMGHGIFYWQSWGSSHPLKKISTRIISSGVKACNRHVHGLLYLLHSS
jgi:hypothetical protein